MKHFDPDRIKEVRAKSGMTQAALEKAVDVGPHYLSKIERGTKPCSLELAQKIARVCGVELWTLYAAVPRDKAIITDWEREFLRCLRQLSDVDRGRVLGVAQTISGGLVPPTDEPAIPVESERVRRLKAGKKKRRPAVG